MSYFRLWEHWPVWTALLLCCFHLHVHVWGMGGMRVAHISMCQVVPACFCIRTSPHSQSSVSVAVAACTCAWFRLHWAHLCCLNLLTPYPPLPSPLFPLNIFPPCPPRPPRACGDAEVMTNWGVEERWIASSGTYHALQAGDVCFWDEEHWVGYTVIQSLEEGAFTADGAGHTGLVCWGKT